MHSLVADFHTNTPLFCAGADQQQASVRLASLKGMLRFYWRSIAYAELGGDIARLHAHESEIFGSTSGQASVRMSLQVGKPGRQWNAKENHAGLAKVAGSTYLGYGVVEGIGSKKKQTQRGDLYRGCLDYVAFKLRLVSRSEFPATLLRAIKLMGLLGSFGSRARKGFGSVTLSQFNISSGPQAESWNAPSDVDSFGKELATQLGNTKSFKNLPKISAFSSHSRVDVILFGEQPLDLLNRYGLMMQRYRSWGQSSNGNIVNGVPSEKRFKDDHDWSKGSPPNRNFHPRRIAFGMPHNYFVDSRSKVVKPDVHERRASPLFYHVHDFGNGQYAGVCFLLQSEFLLGGEKINADRTSVPCKADYRILHAFLDANQIDENGIVTSRPYFPNRVQVW